MVVDFVLCKVIIFGYFGLSVVVVFGIYGKDIKVDGGWFVKVFVMRVVNFMVIVKFLRGGFIFLVYFFFCEC